MNYIDWELGTSSPSIQALMREMYAKVKDNMRAQLDRDGYTFEPSPSAACVPLAPSANAHYDANADTVSLRAQLERATATADFLAASGDALRAENGSLRAYILLDALSGHIVLTRSAIDKAPPGVRDWLKAFGVYDGGTTMNPPVSEPAKSPDPRSDALGHAMSIRSLPNGYGRVE